ncbi:MAG: hypothetical protein HQL92_07755 [Magnetococcales bacterium]|nr:hypothetical protein [Magnetococcales bacterium]
MKSKTEWNRSAMHGNAFVKSLPTLALCAAFGLAFPGCGGGGGGGGGSAGGSGITLVTAQDGNIVGLTVRDSSTPAQIATEIGNGQYRFATVATLPVRGVSNNTLDAQGNVVGTVHTYQDMDGDGRFTTNIDIPYNGNMRVAYAPDRTSVMMNPVAALIPSNWNGTSAIAGLSSSVLNYAVTEGVPPATNTSSQAPVIRSVSSRLTAIQENLIRMGADKTKMDDLLQTLGTAPNVNLDGNAGSLETSLKNAIDSTRLAASELFPGAGVTETQIENAVSRLTTALDSVNTNTLTHPEAVVAALTNTVDSILAGQTTAAGAVNAISNATLTGFNAAVQDMHNAISTGIQNVQSQLGALFGSLYIMPVYDPATTANTGVTPRDASLSGLTNFALTYNDTAKTVTLSGTGSMAFVNKTLTFSEDDNLYGWASTNNQNAAAINLNYAGFRLFSFTSDGGDTQHQFALATQSEICAFRFDDGRSLSQKTGASQTLLDEIRAMNAAHNPALQCTTPND